MIEAARYRVAIAPLSPEDGGGFVATAPDLPGCMSDGATPAEALANVYDAIGCWIEAAIEFGHEVPEPSQKLRTA
jgi:antitoxin HicB